MAAASSKLAYEHAELKYGVLSPARFQRTICTAKAPFVVAGK